MKRTIITAAVLSILSVTAHARSVSRPASFKPKATNVLDATGFDLRGDKMIFSQLPAKALSICITDEYGNVEVFTDIKRGSNTIDVAHLPDGRHTITLKQGNAIKTLGYYSGTVVRAQRS